MGGAAGAHRARRSCRRLAGLATSCRSARRGILVEGGRAAAGADRRRGVRARRAYLDLWGLLPSPDALQAFVADKTPDKRERLVATLLADDRKYAEHWISFWNDLLRNEDGQTYFSEQNGRRSITDWLMGALTNNLPYDQFVAKLLNPSQPGDPEGFLIGVNWRGETSAAVTPWMQASQNTAQAFLGVNFKCNACHDSFVSKWKLKDAYGLAGVFLARAQAAALSLRHRPRRVRRAGVLLSRASPPGRVLRSRGPARDRRRDLHRSAQRAHAANAWSIGSGRSWSATASSPNSDEMDGKPWSPELLDWLASDFVAHSTTTSST